MSGISSLSALSGVPVTRDAASSMGSQTLGQADFLRLMTTQMTSQDPFKPMDSTQMVAQMAQFSQVAGIAEMNQSLKAIAARTASSFVQGVADWIGRSALVDSEIIAPLPDGSMRGEVLVESPVNNVTLVLADAQGREVRRIELGAAGRGALPFAIPAEADGQPLTMRAVLNGSTGSSAAATRAWTTVEAVDAPGGPSPALHTPIGPLNPASVLRLT